ncbi:MAG: hypothetical protein JOZ71_10680 [Ktedonobacteraceae bacterium]|nr:hypothetical protein [Ktedonobacteraceae bacterium]
MLNDTETTSIRTTVPVLSVPQREGTQEPAPLPSLRNFDTYVPLRIVKARYLVSRTLKDGYLAACKAYADMDKNPGGAYIFLTGYEYAHLARQHMPGKLSRLDTYEWHRGFLLGWNVSTFGLESRPRKQ